MGYYKNYYNELLDRQVNSFNCPSDFDIKNLTLGGTLSLTSGNVTTALGFTPYDSTNPSGYITSAALSGYLLSSTAAATLIAVRSLNFIEMLFHAESTGWRYS